MTMSSRSTLSCLSASACDFRCAEHLKRMGSAEGLLPCHRPPSQGPSRDHFQGLFRELPAVNDRAPTHLKIDVEPKRLMASSEPYVIFGTRGFQPVLDVVERKSKRDHFIYISARSLGIGLQKLAEENGGSLVGCDFWVHKSGEEKTALYIVEAA